MKHWKIGTRITAGFAAVVLIAAALGLFAHNRVSEIEKKTDDISGNYLPSVLALGVVRANVHRALLDLEWLADSTDPAESAKLSDEIASLRAESKKALEVYESTPSTPEEAKVYEDFKTAWAGYWKCFEEIQRAGQSTDPAEIAKAKDLFQKGIKPFYKRDVDDLDRLVEIDKQGATSGMAAIREAGAASKQGIYIGLFLAVALSIPIALYIVRGVTGPLAAVVAALDQIEAGDLTASLDIDTKNEMGRMAGSLNAAVGKMRATLLGVADGAANANSSSRQLADAVRKLASGAQQQAASIEETSASLEQITATVRASADNAKQANQFAAGSREAAEKGQLVVVGAVAAMEEINASSAKISEIISTIDEIAFQTNLLAVNAAIEAARAGEDGRGFAVVASEVRALAGRSAVAAKEIKTLIQDSLRKVERGSELVAKSGETLKGIVGGVKRVTDIVGEMSSASAEQSVGVEQVNKAVTQMEQVTQANAAQTEDLSSTAQLLSEQAERLQELVGAFTLGESAAPREHRDARPPKPAAAHSRPASGAAQRGSGVAAVSVAAGKKTGSASPAPKPARSSAAFAAASYSAPAAASDDSFEEF